MLPPPNSTQTLTGAYPLATNGMPDIIKRAQLGDHEAFKQIYELHINRVFATILRLCADPVWAEEMTQKAFVRAWEMLGSFRGEGSFAGWLNRLAVNVVLLEFRSKKRRTSRFYTTADFFEYDKPAKTSDVTSTIDLENAIAGLPKKARLVFVLHDVKGYKHEEIAKMTGVSSGTTKAQLHRARRLLREKLDR